MSDFVPMTREELSEGMAALTNAGKLGGYCERHIYTALAYLDRAEQDEAAMMRALDLRDKFAAEVVVATQRVEQAEARAEQMQKERDALQASLAILNAAGHYITRHDPKPGACFACGGTG